MSDQIVFTATEARQNFFELLRMAEEGKEPIVVKKDSRTRFKIIKTQAKKVKDKMKIVEAMGKIGLKALPIEQMKKIFSSTHEIKL